MKAPLPHTSMSAEVPFIVWTFRRTGGTKLGDTLFRASKYQTQQHEPFNMGRSFGHITKACRDGASDEDLREIIDKTLSTPVNIKHCVEMVPTRLNRILVGSSVAAGYRHLILYRRNVLDRLMSLHYASVSGIWGKSQVSSKSVEDGLFEQAIPVRKLLAHEKACRTELLKIRAHLMSLKIRPALISFEDVYAEADPEKVRQRLRALLRYLGLYRPDIDEAALIAAITAGEQGTRRQYARFVNYEDMASAVANLGDFVIEDPRFSVQVSRALPAGIKHLSVEVPELGENLGRMIVAGTLLPVGDHQVTVLVDDAEGIRPVRMGLSSPWLRTQFPRTIDADRAGFRLPGVRMPGQSPVRLLGVVDGGNPVELACIARMETAL